MIDVCVVGSLNIDLVVKTPRLPQIGETVSGGVFATYPGGKGANQAVAAARLGARVTMVGRVGTDAFGERQLAGLRAEGIDVSHVTADPDSATGVALITVDAVGKNTIVVAPGANARLRPEDIEAASGVIAAARVVLLQLEVPLDTVMLAARRARAAGAVVCLDPAPAAPVPADLYPLLDVIDPNETESAALTGEPVTTIEDAERAAKVLVGRGARAAVVKLGARGAFFLSASGRAHVPAIPVTAIDTTAAGDAFAAALGVGLGEGKGLQDAVRFATRAAALKVTRMGAQSLPMRREVDEARFGSLEGGRDGV